MKVIIRHKFKFFNSNIFTTRPLILQTLFLSEGGKMIFLSAMSNLSNAGMMREGGERLCPTEKLPNLYNLTPRLNIQLLNKGPHNIQPENIKIWAPKQK